MSRKIQLYLNDIQRSCQRVSNFTAGLTFEQFQQTDVVYDAVLHNLQIIGEAAKNIPEDIRLRYPTVEWRKISGFRDIVAHQYFSISDSIVWDIVQNKIPGLLGEITRIMQEL